MSSYNYKLKPVSKPRPRTVANYDRPWMSGLISAEEEREQRTLTAVASTSLDFKYNARFGLDCNGSPICMVQDRLPKSCYGTDTETEESDDESMPMVPLNRRPQPNPCPLMTLQKVR